MVCSDCGGHVAEGARFCPYCGRPVSVRGGGVLVLGDAVAGRDFIGRDRIGDEFHTEINLNFVAPTREDTAPFQAPPLVGYVSRPEATAPIRLSLLNESSANEVLLVTAVQGLGGIGKRQ